jgi:hypothetical protein
MCIIRVVLSGAQFFSLQKTRAGVVVELATLPKQVENTAFSID